MKNKGLGNCMFCESFLFYVDCYCRINTMYVIGRDRCGSMWLISTVSSGGVSGKTAGGASPSAAGASSPPRVLPRLPRGLLPPLMPQLLRRPRGLPHRRYIVRRPRIPSLGPQLPRRYDRHRRGLFRRWYPPPPAVRVRVSLSSCRDSRGGPTASRASDGSRGDRAALPSGSVPQRETRRRSVAAVVRLSCRGAMFHETLRSAMEPVTSERASMA